MSGRPKVVVLGMMTKMPVAGVVWQTVHYLLGFERLGYEAWYVEAHARTPSMLMEREDDDAGALAAGFIDGVMRRFGLGQQWAFHALHDDGACYGMSRSDLDRLYRDAALVVNLHGGTEPRPEHYATGRLVYVETDPVQLQIELADGRQSAIDFLEPHCAFFTFGENYGRPGCGLPVSERFPFLPTRQPVLVDLWEHSLSPRPPFTTIGNWRQEWRTVSFGGDTYTWSKHVEWEKVVDLPRLSGVPLELALASYRPEDERRLREHGWEVRPALALSGDAGVYRDYIQRSRGEFSVAKDQNVRFRSGWFSDRSATYLAAGRPVVCQDTGFGAALPVGEGLLAFHDADTARDALQAVWGDYERHARAARDIARDYFDAERVLGDLLADLGERPQGAARRSRPAVPPNLDLEPVSRRPLQLAEDTVAAIEATRLPVGVRADEPAVSVVVVCWNGMAFTRLALASALGNTRRSDVEFVVVDNASTDGTASLLSELAAGDARVRVITNADNLGFAAGVNQGLAAARGERLVILNNDVVVGPAWLQPLLAHLDDPAVGLVGPVTNRAGNEARIATTYRTYAEMVRFARQRRHAHARRSTDIAVATLFCAALRRDVYDAVGPLDERYGRGLFEDDDYSHAVRAAGFRVVCAADSFVHHFGEAAFGSLVATGEYAALFDANRARFESKWNTTWTPHAGRPDAAYEGVVGAVRAAVDEHLPVACTVAVISRGDDRLVALGDRTAWHFPMRDDGRWTGHHPGGSEEALDHLRRVRDRGADYLVVPHSARWWLDHYAEFGRTVASFPVAVDDASCTVFRIGEKGS